MRSRKACSTVGLISCGDEEVTARLKGKKVDDDDVHHHAVSWWCVNRLRDGAFTITRWMKVENTLVEQNRVPRILQEELEILTRAKKLEREK